MPVKILAVVVLALFLSGCATTKKGNNAEIQQLNGRVTSLETDLQTREREIARLEDELEKAREKRPVLKEKRIKGVKQVESKELSTTQIQSALKNTGFYRGAVDGKMAQATIEAIKAFQRANGLKADGIVGKKTRAILTRYSTGSSENWVK